MTYLIVTLSLFVLSTTATQAALYTWVDEEGIFHSSDDFSKVPEKYQKVPEQQDDEKPVEADWIPLGQAYGRMKKYYDRRSIEKVGNTITITTRTIYKPPQNSGLRDSSGEYLKIATIETDELLNCRDRTWQVLDRRYYGKEGQSLDLLKKHDASPQPSEPMVISEHDYFAAALYRELCASR